MAIAVKVIYQYRDDKGKSAQTEVKIPTGLSVADMTTFALGMAQLIDPLTRGALTYIGINLGVDFSATSGIKADPLTGADVEEKGEFQWRTEGGFYSSMQIPCLDEDLVVTGSDVLSLTANSGVVQDFIDAMTGGVDIDPPNEDFVQPCDAREDDIESVGFYRETFLSSGRRR